MKNIFFLLLGAFILSCKQPKAFVYRATNNFNLQADGLKQTQIAMNVLLYNPNKYPIKLKDADLDILLNEHAVGNMSVKEKLSIPGLDTFSLPVKLSVNLQSVFPNAIESIFNGQISLKLKGSLKASRHGLFITIPVDYESKQDLRAALNW